MKVLKVLGVLLVTGVLLAGCGYLLRFEITRLQAGLPSFTHGAGPVEEHMVAMRDGVRLYTTVSYPDGEGPFPTMLVRSPYAQFGDVMRDQMCGRFIRYGYACVYQDARGQGGSEGEWNPGASEVDDGRDTLNWIVSQSFQDGNIGMMGPSYLGAVQLAAAAGGLPEEVKTLVPAVWAADLREVVYMNGMFRHETFTAWSSMNRGKNTEVDGTGEDYQRAIRHLPHNEVDTEIFGTPLPWYQMMISHEHYHDSFLEDPATMALLNVPANLDIPILMIGGWYDVFLGPQVKDWQNLATRSQSRFVLGPWTHIGGTGGAFKIDNAEGGLFQWLEMLPWLEHHLKGQPLTQEPGVYAYTMGINDWTHFDEWPGETSQRQFFLSNLDSANHCSGGRLSKEAAQSVTQISYDYDPADPVPTRGGAGMLAFILPGYEGAPPADVLQDGLCERDDVLTFVTEPLDEPITIAGNIRADLKVSSTAPDTAFTIKLIEVFADGRAINIRDAISSLSHRNSSVEPLTYEPGSELELSIETWPIEWQLSAGSRLRLDISSSDFPKFHAHRNRAGPWAEHDGMDVATQTLLGGTLTLPVR